MSGHVTTWCSSSDHRGVSLDEVHMPVLVGPVVRPPGGERARLLDRKIGLPSCLAFAYARVDELLLV